MDDLPSLDPNFAGPAASSATPKRNLDAGVLETIQRVLGCPDVDRLPGVLANRYERRIALPGARTEALDVMRLGSTSTTRTGRPTKPCYVLVRMIVEPINLLRFGAGVFQSGIMGQVKNSLYRFELPFPAEECGPCLP
jgi:hypothetical protein